MPVISIPWSPLHSLLFLLYCSYVQTQDISYKACISVFNMPNPNRCYISSMSIFSKPSFSSSIALIMCRHKIFLTRLAFPCRGVCQILIDTIFHRYFPKPFSFSYSIAPLCVWTEELGMFQSHSLASRCHPHRD